VKVSRSKLIQTSTEVREENAVSEANLLKFNTALLIVIIALLLWGLFWKPPSAGRFQPVGSPRMALDSKTGRLCATVGPASESLPLCPYLK
jgi:hypothetical protein